MTRYWRCRRVTNGQVCGELNLATKKKCYRCGKLRPRKRQPAHREALKLPYEEYVALNGGDFCGICGAPRAGRALDRDHAHDATKRPRGLLCRKCNRFLVQQRYGLRVTPEWLRAAADYMERAA